MGMRACKAIQLLIFMNESENVYRNQLRYLCHRLKRLASYAYRFFINKCAKRRMSGRFNEWMKMETVPAVRRWCEIPNGKLMNLMWCNVRRCVNNFDSHPCVSLGDTVEIHCTRMATTPWKHIDKSTGRQCRLCCHHHQTPMTSTSIFSMVLDFSIVIRCAMRRN